MHFVFISGMSLYPWGGSEELWSQAALRLFETGHRVTVSVPFWRNVSPRVARLAEKGIELRFHCSSHSPFAIRGWQKVRRQLGWQSKEFQWLRGQKADMVVISQGGITDGLQWMKICHDLRMPYVAIIQCNSESWWPAAEVAAELCELYQSALKVFCVSRRNLELLERQIACRLPNAEVVWNPFNALPGELPPLWPEENGCWSLACVARLEPAAKGQDLLFEVLGRPRWRERPVEVNLYGAGASEQNLRKLSEHMDLRRVCFRGHVQNVRDIWERNCLLVLPSRYEGFPLALMEAMWCARPAVVTDVGGCSEVCVDNETGFVVPAATAELLEQTMERAWSRRHDWRDLGRAARAMAEKMIPQDPVGAFCGKLSQAATQLPKPRAALDCSASRREIVA